MNDNNNTPKKPSSQNGPARFELPDGTFGVYMGETGRAQTENRRSVRANGDQSRKGAYSNGAHGTPLGNMPQGNMAHRNRGAEEKAFPQNSIQGADIPPQRRADVQMGQASNNETGARNAASPRNRGYTLSEAERREIERRHAYDRARRKAAAEGRINKHRTGKGQEPSVSEGILKYVSYYLHSIWDRIYMGWMGITVDLDTIIKIVIIAGMILLFAMLQTTVFSRFALFGATPDLMLGLVVAVGSTEGERWGSATGLAAAVLIEALGGGTLTLLPLLYSV